MFDRSNLTREALEAYSLDLRQFLDFREARLPDGQRIIEATSASGVSFTLLPDRGFDIWSARYHGLPLTWLAAGSPFAADSGQSWLRQFNGGLLTTCGLTHVGGGEKDSGTGEYRDLHGTFTRLKAHRIALESPSWQPSGDCTLSIEAELHESVLFGVQWHIKRRVTLALQRPVFHVGDTITNQSDMVQPLMILYHINVGYPLVRAGVELDVASTARPRDAAAEAGFKTWARYDSPQDRYPEQVFFHHVSGIHHRATAALIGGNFGLRLDWNLNEMPYLTQWKNTRQGIYVCGIEPGNCIPEGLNSARSHGRIETLAPGESRTFGCTFTVLHDAETVQSTRDEITAARESGIPSAGFRL